jgi:hypothetical protein
LDKPKHGRRLQAVDGGQRRLDSQQRVHERFHELDRAKNCKKIFIDFLEKIEIKNNRI